MLQMYVAKTSEIVNLPTLLLIKDSSGFYFAIVLTCKGGNKIHA